MAAIRGIGGPDRRSSSNGPGETPALVDLFDRIAPSYNRIGPRFFDHYGEELVRAAELFPGARVLDVGAGPGTAIPALSRAVGDRGWVVATDVSLGMLSRARTSIASAPSATSSSAPSPSAASPSPVALSKTDACELCFADHTFDRLICGFGLNLFPYPMRAMSELHRVLRPNSLGALTIWAPDCPYFQWLDSTFYQLCVGVIGHAPAADRHPFFPSAEALKATLQLVGFTEVRVEHRSDSFFYDDREQWWDALCSSCFQARLDRLPSETLPSAKSFFQDRVEALEVGGRIKADLNVWLAVGKATPEDRIDPTLILGSG